MIKILIATVFIYAFSLLGTFDKDASQHNQVTSSIEIEKDSLGDFVETFDFGATLYVSSHQTDEALIKAIKSKYEGKTVILDLWGTFCPPCLKDFKTAQKVKEELKANNIEVLYLCAGRSSKPTEWKKVIKENQLIGNHIYLDRALTGEYMEAFGINRYPSYIILNKEGEFIKNKVSSITRISPSRFVQQYSE